RGRDPRRGASGARRRRERGRAAAGDRHRGVLLRVRHRDRRGAGQVLRPGRDHVDARQRAALPGAAAAGHGGADPGGGPQVSRRRPRPNSVPACGESMTIGRRLAVTLLAVTMLIVPGPAPAQAPAENVRLTRLANGLTVVVRENPVAPVVAIALLVRMGSRWETPDNAGISNFTHAVMVKGTAKRGGGELAEAVAGLGGKISASGDVDYSGIQASALARYWRDLLELTAEPGDSRVADPHRSRGATGLVPCVLSPRAHDPGRERSGLRRRGGRRGPP